MTLSAGWVAPQVGTGGDPYLKLRLDAEITALIPMVFAQEVLVVPEERLTLIPNMPAWALGLLNQRSRVFWVVDLLRLFNQDAFAVSQRLYNIVILRADQMPLGIAVPQVNGVLRFPSEALQSPVGAVSDHLTPYLRGCVPWENDILLVLDPQAIVRAAVRAGSAG
nr:chemotaxis protein CheW [Petrachloros mirabilis]